MRTRVGGGPKIRKFCGRHMCIAPYTFTRPTGQQIAPLHGGLLSQIIFAPRFLDDVATHVLYVDIPEGEKEASAPSCVKSQND